MDELIKSTHKKWREAKTYAAKRCKRTRPDLAAQLNNCQMFTGKENLAELASLIFEPQSREFMLANLFPNLSIFRKFKSYNPEQFGVYIDCGSITLNDPGKVFLIGNTHAEVFCRKTISNTVVMMHGAEADIYAGGYSVVTVETDRKSHAKITASQTAKVL